MLYLAVVLSSSEADSQCSLSLSFSLSQLAASLSTWWASVPSVTPTPTARPRAAALAMTTGTRMGMATEITAMEVTGTAMVDMDTPMGDMGILMVLVEGA